MSRQILNCLEDVLVTKNLSYSWWAKFSAIWVKQVTIIYFRLSSTNAGDIIGFCQPPRCFSSTSNMLVSIFGQTMQKHDNGSAYISTTDRIVACQVHETKDDCNHNSVWRTSQIGEKKQEIDNVPCLHLVYQSTLVSNLKLWVLRVKITFCIFSSGPRLNTNTNLLFACIYMYLPRCLLISISNMLQITVSCHIAFWVTLLGLCQAGPVAKSKRQVSASILQTVDGVNAVISKEKKQSSKHTVRLIYQCLSMIFGYNTICFNSMNDSCTVTLWPLKPTPPCVLGGVFGVFDYIASYKLVGSLNKNQAEHLPNSLQSR